MGRDGDRTGSGSRRDPWPDAWREQEEAGVPIARPAGRSVAPTFPAPARPGGGRDQWMEHLADVRLEMQQTTDRLGERLGFVEASSTADALAAGLAAKRRQAEEAKLWLAVRVSIGLSSLALVLAIPALLGVLGILFKGWAHL